MYEIMNTCYLGNQGSPLRGGKETAALRRVDARHVGRLRRGMSTSVGKLRLVSMGGAGERITPSWEKHQLQSLREAGRQAALGLAVLSRPELATLP